jgi:hypothetical protein
MNKLFQTLVAIAYVLLPIDVLALTRYVAVNSSNPAPPYTNWATAAATIQAAIDLADPGDVVLVTNGVYETGGRALSPETITNRVAVTKVLTVQSVNGPEVTLIKGLRSGTHVRCAYLTNGASIRGFTFTNGSAGLFVGGGGGIVCVTTNARVFDSIIISNNAPGNGSGVSSGTLSNCAIIGNSGPGSGAVGSVLNDCSVIASGGVLLSTLNRCVLIGNTNDGPGGAAYQSTLNGCLIASNSAAQYGGGVFDCVLTDCTLRGNYSGGRGGGADTSTLNRCLIAGNTAQSGGGAYDCTLNNCIVTGNSAQFNGGAAVGAAYNCTIVGNTASHAGGTSGKIFNSIIYYNTAATAPNCTAVPVACCTVPYFGDDPTIVTNEPLFVDAVNGDYRLQSNSPCINSGRNSFVTNNTDFSGGDRIIGATVDIGAHEFAWPGSAISYAWLQRYGLPIDGSADGGDTDGDRHNNWQEWRANTVPTNSASVLRLRMPMTFPTGSLVSWQSAKAVSYSLQRSTNMGLMSSFATIRSNLVGAGNTISVLDSEAVNPGAYFYRVRVEEW